MLTTYTYRIFLLLSFLKAGNVAAQVYCPAEETFFGPVVSVNETIYELPVKEKEVAGYYLLPQKTPSIVKDNHIDSLLLTSKSISKVRNGLIIEKQILGASGFQRCRCTKSYSEAGQEREKTTFGSNDSVDTRVVYTRSNGLVTKRTVYDIHNEIFSSRVYIYDSLNRTSVSKEVFDDHEENIVLTELNSNYKPSKSYSVDSLGSKRLYSEYTYDSFGRVIATHYWNLDSKYDQHYFTTYDSLGREIKRSWFNRDSIFMGTDSIVYDTNSNITFEHSYDFITGTWSSYLYNYQLDEFGNFLVKEIWSISRDDSFLKSRIVRAYSYDE